MNVVQIMYLNPKIKQEDAAIIGRPLVQFWSVYFSISDLERTPEQVKIFYDKKEEEKQ